MNIRLRTRPSGFTLIELMVVIAIIGGAVVLAMPYIGSRNQEVKGFFRHFTVLSRDLHTKAKLQGTAFRIVIDLATPGAGLEAPKQSYWIEQGNAKVVLSEGEEEKALERSKEGDEDRKKDPKGFQKVGEAKPLPAGLRFEKVELTRSKNPITEGRAFIHYLPQGLVDEAAIHIKGQKQQAWTIAIHPLTGKAELIQKTVNLKEIRDQ